MATLEIIREGHVQKCSQRRIGFPDLALRVGYRDAHRGLPKAGFEMLFGLDDRLLLGPADRKIAAGYPDRGADTASAIAFSDVQVHLVQLAARRPQSGLPFQLIGLFEEAFQLILCRLFPVPGPFGQKVLKKPPLFGHVPRHNIEQPGKGLIEEQDTAVAVDGGQPQIGFG